MKLFLQEHNLDDRRFVRCTQSK